MNVPAYTLRDGQSIPQIGLGTYRLDGAEGLASMVQAIESGYRLLDTAYNYGNEAEVGQALVRSGIDRAELFVTTKLPGRHHGFDETLESFEESRARLDLDWLDLYLIHWPNPSVDRYVESWRAMIRLREKGLVRSIGVSNFTAPMLARLEDETGVVPAINQVELHPYFPQGGLRRYHDDHGIRTQSWSPLGRGSELLAEPVIVDLASAKGVSPARIVLRWHVQLGTIPIPRSRDAARQRENLDVFDFELAQEEVAAISGLERGRLWGADPDEHEEQ
ncbi:aldo/keto reductase [Agromyces seonyuensis]|uniref:Aldo/keto reductase n=1 Tax=Agromyces seonyuensis TaxID=2662446 RepID=A0A6I4NTN2_9MICO|nr:aldo/keto reductase [Agromyces seonyuensis]MWB97630.1 aldo/keto reductase [Agromyces seonyuensis]